MALQVAGKDIADHWTDWAVVYPDGELIVVEDEETADDIIRCAKMVKAKYKKKERLVFVTDWEDA